MSYAVSKDGLSWRAVNSIDDCTVDEYFSTTPPAPKVPTLAELKKSQLTEINDEFEKVMQPITAGIPDIEVKSWLKQEAEARAYQANPDASTPLIDGLASSRNVNKDELVTRIIDKADAYANLSGLLIGRRQGLEDALNALPESATAEDVVAITW